MLKIKKKPRVTEIVLEMKKKKGSVLFKASEVIQGYGIRPSSVYTLLIIKTETSLLISH